MCADGKQKAGARDARYKRVSCFLNYTCIVDGLYFSCTHFPDYLAQNLSQGAISTLM